MDRVVVVVAIGSNLSPRHQHLAHARRRLSTLLMGVRFSSVHETEPEGVSAPQGPFLNQLAVGESELPARQLLEALLAIETEAGRTRPFRGAPRTLDLDLVLHGASIADESGLTVPHPRFRERAFVLEPLVEIAPHLIDPVTGMSVEALLGRLRQVG
jgi:2-amino-4-hydroxy-6-hydroxymethyldihydropteridine diphosphokinase